MFSKPVSLKLNNFDFDFIPDSLCNDVVKPEL